MDDTMEVEIVRLCSKQLDDKSQILRKERFFKGRIHYDRSVRSGRGSSDCRSRGAPSRSSLVEGGEGSVKGKWKV